MLKYYRNFTIKIVYLKDTISAKIYIDDEDESFAFFASPDLKELEQLARFWIDETLKAEKYFVRRHRKSKSTKGLSALQNWLS